MLIFYAYPYLLYEYLVLKKKNFKQSCPKEKKMTIPQPSRVNYDKSF